MVVEKPVPMMVRYCIPAAEPVLGETEVMVAGTEAE